MPRPVTYKHTRVQFQMRLTAALRKRLEREAGRRQVSKNLLAERALEEALSRWEKESLDTADAALV